MNKTILTLVLSAATIVAGAQVVEVQSVDRVAVAGGVSVNVPRISPDGAYAVLSTNTDNALYRVDLATGISTKVANQGSANDLTFSPDGSTIVFKTSETRDNQLRYYSVQMVDMTDGFARRLSEPARHCAQFSVSPSGVLSLSDNGRYSARNMAGQKVQASGMPVVSIHYGHLELTTPDGTTVTLDPQGRGSYLWPQLSPDGTNIVYYLARRGCFVCDLDGSNVRPLGYIHGARWINNESVVGFQDYDNGTEVLKSTIVAANLQGTIQTLTDDSVIGINPSVSADGSRIVFSTIAGDLYVINLK